MSRDEEQAKRILRGLVLGLGPWSQSLLFDINGDIPKLDSNDFTVVGDLLLGPTTGKGGALSAMGLFTNTTSALV